jgi:hypothetical protein
VLGYSGQIDRWHAADGWQVIQTPDGPDDAWPEFVEDGEGGYLPVEDEAYHARYAAVIDRLRTALAVSPPDEATDRAMSRAADASLVADRTAVHSAFSVLAGRLYLRWAPIPRTQRRTTGGGAAASRAVTAT